MKDESAKAVRKKRVSLVLRVGLTLVLLAGLAFLVDWPHTLAVVLDARWGFIVAAFACVLGARAAITWRWGRLLALGGLRPRFGDLFRIVSGSMAFASLLPSSLGTDVARGAFLGIGMAGEDSRKPTEVIASIAVDRYAATLGTLVVASIGAAAAGFGLVAAATVMGIVAILFVTWLMLRGSSAVIRLFTPGPLKRLRPKVEALVGMIRRPGMIRRGLIPAVLISMLVTLLRTGVFISLYFALDQDIPLGLAFFAIPMMIMALMVPVTVGGFGVREWLLVISFQAVGISKEVSIAVGLLAFTIQTLVSIPPLLALLLKRRPTVAVGAVPEPEGHSK